MTVLLINGIVIGSPVYFAGPNGVLCALLDRVFYAASNFGYHLADKLGTANRMDETIQPYYEKVYTCDSYLKN